MKNLETFTTNTWNHPRENFSSAKNFHYYSLYFPTSPSQPRLFTIPTVSRRKSVNSCHLSGPLIRSYDRQQSSAVKRRNENSRKANTPSPSSSSSSRLFLAIFVQLVQLLGGRGRGKVRHGETDRKLKNCFFLN